MISMVNLVELADDVTLHILSLATPTDVMRM